MVCAENFLPHCMRSLLRIEGVVKLTLHAQIFCLSFSTITDYLFTEFAKRALLLFFKTRAWSSAHHSHQSQLQSVALEEEINDVIAIEAEQGRSLCPELPHVLPPLATSSLSWHYYCSSLPGRLIHAVLLQKSLGEV